MDHESLAQLLEDLHGEVAQGLLEKIRSREASAAEYTAAIKLLSQNSIQLSTRVKAGPLFDLKTAIEDLDLELPN